MVLLTCLHHSRARSTKTRIETLKTLVAAWDEVQIREQDPLKQGLKQPPPENKEGGKLIREQDPLKQGLKRFKNKQEAKIWVIREQDPLKQGLKQTFYDVQSIFDCRPVLTDVKHLLKNY